MTLLIQGGTVLTAQGARSADVRIDGDLITAVGELRADLGDELLDATGCLVFPGGVETHTHLDLECGPGLVTADDFATGTRAALAGGTTTVLDFATQFHGQTLAEGLARWRGKAEGKAVIDYGFHLAMTQWQPEFAAEMADMVAQGVTSFKLYMAYKGSMMVRDHEIRQALAASAALGTTIGFHCENGDLVLAMAQDLVAAGHTSPHFHPKSRPAELEAEAAHRLGVIAALEDAQAYVVHLSAAATIDQVRQARAHGARLIAETCPQYLLLDESAYGPEHPTPEQEAQARKYVMSPPPRTQGGQEAIWAALADGDIQFVGTDHCSFTTAQKADGAAFNQVANGGPGIELRIPLLYTYGLATGRLTPGRFVEVTSTNAARYFGLADRKGDVAPGFDADLVVYDPRPSSTVRHADLHDATDYTPYEGMALQGRVRDVFLRGQHLVRDGEPIPDLPPGQFLARGLPDGTIR